MSEYIAHDHQHDGIDRKGFLRCMAWAGTGVVFGVVSDRVVTTALADVVQGKAAAPAATFSFDYKGVHFLALANVEQAEAEGKGLSGLGRLGPQQLAFIKKDLAALSSD